MSDRLLRRGARRWYKMQAWCARHQDDPMVRWWLGRNPPPTEWQGTPMEWAYTEMPVPIAWLAWVLEGRPRA